MNASLIFGALAGGLLVLVLVLVLVMWLVAKACVGLHLKDQAGIEGWMKEFLWVIGLGTAVTVAAALLDQLTAGTVVTDLGKVFPGHWQVARGAGIAGGAFVMILALHNLWRATGIAGKSGLEEVVPQLLFGCFMALAVAIGIDRFVAGLAGWYVQMPWGAIASVLILLLGLGEYLQISHRGWRAFALAACVVGMFTMARAANSSPFAEPARQGVSFLLQSLRQTFVPSSHPMLGAFMLVVLVRGLRWMKQVFFGRSEGSAIYVVGVAVWMLVAWILQTQRGEAWAAGSTRARVTSGESSFAGYLVALAPAITMKTPLLHAAGAALANELRVPTPDQRSEPEKDAQEKRWPGEAMEFVRLAYELPPGDDRQRLVSSLMTSNEQATSKLADAAQAHPGPAAAWLLTSLIAQQPLTADKSKLDSSSLFKALAQAAVAQSPPERVQLLLAIYPKTLDKTDIADLCVGAMPHMTVDQALPLARQLATDLRGTSSSNRERIMRMARNLRHHLDQAPEAVVQNMLSLAIDLDAELRPTSYNDKQEDESGLWKELVRAAFAIGGESGFGMLDRIVEQSHRDEDLLGHFLQLAVNPALTAHDVKTGIPAASLMSLVAKIAARAQEGYDMSWRTETLLAVLKLGARATIPAELFPKVAEVVHANKEVPILEESIPAFARFGGGGGAEELIHLLARLKPGEQSRKIVAHLVDLAATGEPAVVDAMKKQRLYGNDHAKASVSETLLELAWARAVTVSESPSVRSNFPQAEAGQATVRWFEGAARTLLLAGGEKPEDLLRELIEIHGCIFNKECHGAWIRIVVSVLTEHTGATLLCLRAGEAMNDENGCEIIRHCVKSNPRNDTIGRAALGALASIPAELRRPLLRDIVETACEAPFRYAKTNTSFLAECCRALVDWPAEDRLPLIAKLVARDPHGSELLRTAVPLIVAGEGEGVVAALESIISPVTLNLKKDDYHYSYGTNSDQVDESALVLAACVKALGRRPGDQVADIPVRVTKAASAFSANKSKEAIFEAVFAYAKGQSQPQRLPLLIQLEESINDGLRYSSGDLREKVAKAVAKDAPRAEMIDVQPEWMLPPEGSRSQAPEKKGLLRRLFGR